MSLMCMISLLMGEPLETLFGYDTCIAFYLVVLLHNCFIACGFVSSIYRLMCVKSKGQNISAKTLVICEYVFLLFAYIPGKFYHTTKNLDMIGNNFFHYRSNWTSFVFWNRKQSGVLYWHFKTYGSHTFGS